MAQLTIADIARTGLTVSRVAVDPAGDTIAQAAADRGRLMVSIANASALSRTLTIVTPQVVDDDLAVADRTVTLSGNSESMVGPFLPTSTYVNTSGNIELNYSDSGNSLTVQALRLPTS